jgi:hypothetical protein
MVSCACYEALRLRRVRPFSISYSRHVLRMKLWLSMYKLSPLKRPKRTESIFFDVLQPFSVYAPVSLLQTP